MNELITLLLLLLAGIIIFIIMYSQIKVNRKSIQKEMYLTKHFIHFTLRPSHRVLLPN